MNRAAKHVHITRNPAESRLALEVEPTQRARVLTRAREALAVSSLSRGLGPWPAARRAQRAPTPLLELGPGPLARADRRRLRSKVPGRGLRPSSRERGAATGGPVGFVQNSSAHYALGVNRHDANHAGARLTAAAGRRPRARLYTTATSWPKPSALPDRLGRAIRPRLPGGEERDRFTIVCVSATTSAWRGSILGRYDDKEILPDGRYELRRDGPPGHPRGLSAFDRRLRRVRPDDPQALSAYRRRAAELSARDVHGGHRQAPPAARRGTRRPARRGVAPPLRGQGDGSDLALSPPAA